MVICRSWEYLSIAGVIAARLILPPDVSELVRVDARAISEPRTTKGSPKLSGSKVEAVEVS